MILFRGPPAAWSSRGGTTSRSRRTFRTSRRSSSGCATPRTSTSCRPRLRRSRRFGPVLAAGAGRRVRRPRLPNARDRGTADEDCYRRALRRRRIPTSPGLHDCVPPWDASSARCGAPPCRDRPAPSGGSPRWSRPEASDARSAQVDDVRRGVTRSTFHVVGELVPEERLLFLSSRPGSPPAARTRPGRGGRGSVRS